MAGEQGAHLHTISQPDDDSNSAPPDIFSIVAQESLLNTAQPAFQHLVKVRFHCNNLVILNFIDYNIIILHSYFIIL